MSLEERVLQDVLSLLAGPDHVARERKELSEDPAFELDELADIYVKRGVDQTLARQVAQQLMAKDALTAHARDELGISEITKARPVQAALTSAVMFSVGAAAEMLEAAWPPAPIEAKFSFSLGDL